MAKGNFTACLAKVLAWEGGYVDNPKDPGGATNMGITLNTLALWRKQPVTAFPKSEVKALTKAEASEIYEAQYWRPVKGDDLPAGVDLGTFDYGVNSGTGTAAKQLQRVVGVTADGAIGPATLAAVNDRAPSDVIKQLCAKRLSTLKALTTWGTFGKGWTNRVTSIEASALAMVLTPSQLQVEAGEARAKSNAQAGGAVAAGAGGTGGIVTDQGHTLPIGFIIAAVVIVAGILIVRTIINRQRAAALARAAQEA